MFVVVIVQLPIQALVPLLVNLRQQLRARIHVTAAIAARLHVLVLVLLPRRHHYNVCLLPPPSSAILVTKVFGVAGGVMLYICGHGGGWCADRFLQGLVVEGGEGGVGGGGDDPGVEPGRSSGARVVQQVVVLPGPDAGLPPPRAVPVPGGRRVLLGLVAVHAGNVVVQRPGRSPRVVGHPVAPAHLLLHLPVVDIVRPIPAVLVVVVPYVGRPRLRGRRERHQSPRLRHDCVLDHSDSLTLRARVVCRFL